MCVNVSALLVAALTSIGAATEITQTPPPDAPINDSTLPDLIIAANESLRAQGMDYQIEGVEFLNGTKERVSIQLHRQDYGWVSGDPRRADSQLPGLGWAMDRTWPEESNRDTAYLALAKAAERAASAWNSVGCVGSRAIVTVHPAEPDVTIFDGLFGRGSIGTPLLADVVLGGFRPDLDAVFGSSTLAFAVTFVFIDAEGEPSDIDGDGRMDTAATEIYLNEYSPWAPWAAGGYDLTTVLLHEFGHALGLPHFGAPPVAAMNPTYHGSYPYPGNYDYAALCSQYAGRGIYPHGETSPAEPATSDGSRLE